MKRIFRRHDNIPMFDFTNGKQIRSGTSTPSGQKLDLKRMKSPNKDLYAEARPLAMNKPRMFSPMTKYRRDIMQNKTFNLFKY